MTVDLFVPCYMDQFYPATAFSVVKLLEFTGLKVRYRPEQTCCGQPAYNSGYLKEAKTLAKKFVSEFSDSQVVVTPSASCAAYIRNYYHRLFDPADVEAEEVRRLQPLVFELTDFLVNQIGKVSFGASFPFKVTWHDACSGLRGYGISREPRLLLVNVEGLQLIEMKHTETCCGFGGTFSVKFPHISTAMTLQKVENAIASGADYIVSTEASCLLNIESFIRKNNINIKTIHLADILTTGW